MYKRVLATAVTLTVLCVIIVGCHIFYPSTSLKLKSKEQRDQRMAWWRDAKFGLFIHWGLYAIPAGEWKGKEIGCTGEWIMNCGQIPTSEYEPLAKQFNPVKFNADQWVQIAKNAGVKYIVITSKHHDGFCLWDSRVTDYDIIDATPFKRDVLSELAEVCHKQGIKLCFYYSITDWHHPDAQGANYPIYNNPGKKNPNFGRYVKNYLKPQIKELLTKYGDIGVLWFDGQWISEWTEQQGVDMYNFVQDLQPNIIINNRVGKMKGLTPKGHFGADFGTPELTIPDKVLPGVDWESCMTMNDTWGYKKNDPNWKSAKDLQHKLVEIVSKGGNLLLNIGPTAEGLIPQPSVERLQTIGEWLKVNGESVYGTTASPLEKPSWGCYTQKPGRLYLHVFDWPADGKIKIHGLRNEFEEAYLLADEKHNKLVVAREGENDIVINVPEKPLDPVDTVIVLKIKGLSLSFTLPE